MNEKNLTVLGKMPLATDSNGKLLSRIGTIFVKDGVLITLPGMTHALQRLYYLNEINTIRRAKSEPVLEPEELDDDAIDLIMEGGADASVLIREDNPVRMDLVLEADELLQTIVPKQQICFLYARKQTVQHATRKRGEYWRITPHPKETAEVEDAIRQSKIAIGGLPIYYYCPVTGTRHLTFQAFRELGDLTTELLCQHLMEIQKYSMLRNRHFHYEVSLFGVMPDCGFTAETFQTYDFESADEDRLRAWHLELCEAFEAAVEEKLLSDNVKDEFWRNRMFACLEDKPNGRVNEKLVSGLSEEFFRQIEWLPGGCIKDGEWVFDPIFTDKMACEAGFCDIRVKGFIFNFIREFGGLEYINIGRLLPGLSNRPTVGAHRAYIAEVKHRNAPEPVLRILRVQRWGIREHLEKPEVKGDLLTAILETQDYTEYTLDRRLGCWQLDMPLPGRLDVRTIPEEYDWGEDKDHGISRIWTTYYERDFIEGLATDKVSKTQLANTEFALQLARLLGRAAAPNMVVGRMATNEKDVLFDQGDEMLRLDEAGLPVGIVVADHAGTFVDYTSDLETFAAAYAMPVLSRIEKILEQNRKAFAKTYLTNLEEQLVKMQAKYKQYKAGFDTLFQHSKKGKETFSDRWEHVLKRLKNTDATALVEKIRAVINEKSGDGHHD